ncbi:hypothetical protein AVEN_32542-1 [Araneus ventricosus]|uniref:Uncharacterized protein n=1 Tax=Araneus ventricosus TaxID=182803 RepID=A0A4Y2JHN1_ARAVE|nr:hypothetical protein AVEN_32542-1 [Araneus ventricosus]
MQFNKQDYAERRFFLQYSRKHDAQVTGKTALAQISIRNRQQTTNNSNSTFNTARLPTAYWLALWIRKIPKTAALQRRSEWINTFPKVQQLRVFIVFRQGVTLHGIT